MVVQCVLLGVALFTRLMALRWSAKAGLNADEAVPGLMALHIAGGREWPVFYYGQQYFGALEAYLTAGLFKVVGFQPWLVFVVPTFASLTLVPLSVALARRLPGPGVSTDERKWVGWLGALPVAASTPVMARMLAHAGGGFALAYALQLAALYCVVRASVVEGEARRVVRWAALFALASGLLCWVWQPALPVTAILLVVLCARRPLLLRPLPLMLVIVCLLVGLLPALLYNVVQGYPTVAELLRKAATPPDQAPAAVTGSPWVLVILIAWALSGGEDTTGWGNVAQAIVVTLAFGVVMALAIRATLERARPAGALSVAPVAACIDWRVAGILALAVIAHVVAAHGAVRHLHPAVLIAFVFLGAVPVACFGASARLHRARVSTAGVLALAIAVPNLIGLPIAAGVYQARPRLGEELHELIDGLRARGLTRGYADYWTAYPLTFWSGETIIVAPLGPMTYGGRFDRYPPHTEFVNERVRFDGLFLLAEAQCKTAASTHYLEAAGVSYREERLGRYRLLWDLRSTMPWMERENVEVWRWVIATEDVC